MVILYTRKTANETYLSYFQEILNSLNVKVLRQRVTLEA